MTLVSRARRLLQDVLQPGTARRAAVKEARRLAREATRRARLEQHREQRASASLDGAAETVLLDHPHHEVRLLVTSRMEREWRAHACAKEPWTVVWLEQSMRDGGVLYDIGANTGAFSLLAARIAGPRGTVVSVEPGYASYARLCDNVVLNGVQDRVFPVPFALGEAIGVATFTYNTLQPGQSRHRFDQDQWARRSPSQQRRYSQPMLTMTLDGLIEQFAMPRPRHIKLDVDGAELAVLRGAEKTLASPELSSVLVEIDDAMSEAVVGVLAGHGFVLDSRHKRVHEEETQVWYGVFRRVRHGEPSGLPTLPT